MVGITQLVLAAMWFQTSTTVLAGAETKASATSVDPGNRIVEVQILTFTRFANHQQQIVKDELGRIWDPQGITIRWSCDNEEQCLRLVLIDQRGAGGKRICALGEIPFVDGRPTRTFYIAVNRIRELVRDAIHPNTPGAVRELHVARIAGRAAAHELAHYLLATPQHASTGLLRAVFEATTLLDARLEPFMLEPGQRRALTEGPRPSRDSRTSEKKSPALLPSCSRSPGPDLL